MENYTETLEQLGIIPGEKIKVETTLLIRSTAMANDMEDRKLRVMSTTRRERKGVPVSEETKQKMREASRTKSMFSTPNGIFKSAKAACESHGITLAQLRANMHRGERQRKGLKVHNPDEHDCRQWGRALVAQANLPRPVVTPFGRFPTVKSAATYEGKSPASILRSIREYPENYRYE
jgi:hypothetical protein